MQFADIHMHALYGVDDGPRKKEDMYKMLDMAYADGTRCICMTPHCFPSLFGLHTDKIQAAYNDALAYIAQRKYQLSLALCAELRYNINSISLLYDGVCPTFKNSRYVLVDFSEKESVASLQKGLHSILNAGFRPILAHAERYRSLHGDMREIREFRRNGILIQLDAGALFGEFGLSCKLKCKKILSEHLADFIASDAHNTQKQSPVLSRAYAAVSQKYGSTYADDLFWNRARGMFFPPSQETNTTAQ